MSAQQIMVHVLGGKCSKCGSTEKLHLHHKDHNRKNNELDNIVLLCYLCHAREHGWNMGAKGKFIQSVKPALYFHLMHHAKQRGITIQALIRAVIIPEWLETFQLKGKIKS